MEARLMLFIHCSMLSFVSAAKKYVLMPACSALNAYFL